MLSHNVLGIIVNTKILVGQVSFTIVFVFYHRETAAQSEPEETPEGTVKGCVFSCIGMQCVQKACRKNNRKSKSSELISEYRGQGSHVKCCLQFPYIGQEKQ